VISNINNDYESLLWSFAIEHLLFNRRKNLVNVRYHYVEKRKDINYWPCLFSGIVRI